MSWYRRRRLQSILPVWTACVLFIAACTPISAPLAPSPTPQQGINEQLRAAFEIEDRSARLDTVLTLIPAFLADLSLRNIDDEAASSLLTDIAFSSERMTFTDPAYIRRYNDMAVIGLPDAMGLYYINTYRDDRYPR